ncbi:MAG: hypothetical protein KA472_18660, partial [Pseudomonadales bacterium]|nr:hypothetical protein [Pseudomonadales bacterium]
VINDWQGFDQWLSGIESPWEANPANGGINFAGKWKCLERLGMLVKGSLVPLCGAPHKGTYADLSIMWIRDAKRAPSAAEERRARISLSA